MHLATAIDAYSSKLDGHAFADHMQTAVSAETFASRKSCTVAEMLSLSSVSRGFVPPVE